jgi:hypothetical protein
MPAWSAFWKGESREAMEELVLALIENAGARRSPRQVQKALNLLKLFWRFEAVSLKKVREAMAYPVYPVPQKERDFLYLKRRHQACLVVPHDQGNQPSADRSQDRPRRKGRPGRGPASPEL